MACHKVCKYKLQLQTPSNASFTVIVLVGLANAILCYRLLTVGSFMLSLKLTQTCLKT